ncbi:MAG: nucleotidyltransferase domain-containing protein [Planctomycetota bacterium]
MKDIIVEKLQQIEQHHDVRILWAIESGSRSWRFESPDSDYDVRFIYVNKPQWYLSIQEKRDVIELPVDEVLDISGWDLRKTLRLFKKSNPVLIEWLVSPFVYMQHSHFRDRLLNAAKDCFSRKACSYHYLRMAENNYRRYVQPKDPVNLKKYFYVLRPLLNIFWMKEKDSIPPMSFLDTLEQLSIPDTVYKKIIDLLAKKKESSEIGTGPRIPILEDYIQNSLVLANDFCDAADVGHIDIDSVDAIFRETLVEVMGNRI